MAKKKSEITKPPTDKKKKLISKKKKLISNKKTLNKSLSLLSSESDTESSLLNNLLQPYKKEQLIDILANAADGNTAIEAIIKNAAETLTTHRKIFVHGLGWDATKEMLLSAFKVYGEIEDCNVISDRVTGKSKGYGFVLFKSRKGADKALKEPNKKIGNRIASCQLSSVRPVAPATPTAVTQQDGMGRKIYISNVPTDADPEKLRTFFAKFGEIEMGPLGFDSQSGKCRGFALFVYKTVESAKLAIQDQFKVFDGHQLRCQKAIENKNKVSGAATITTAVQPLQQPVLAAMAAAQNMAMMSQQYQYQYPNLNPLYSGLLTNPMVTAQGYVGSGQLGGYGATGLGQLGGYGETGSGQLGGFGATGQGQQSGYGATMPSQLNKLGGGLGSSVLGAFGASGSSQVGLQQAYLGASARTPGAAGVSYTGLTNPAYKR